MYELTFREEEEKEREKCIRGSVANLVGSMATSGNNWINALTRFPA